MEVQVEIDHGSGFCFGVKRAVDAILEARRRLAHSSRSEASGQGKD